MQHVASVGERKKPESPTGIEPMTSQILLGGRSIATRTHDEQSHILGSYAFFYRTLRSHLF